MTANIPRAQKEYSDKSRSALQCYQDMIIGDRSLVFLLKFELIMLLFGRIPGALGLVLRKIFFPLILGSVGNNVVFGANISIRHPKKIFIGQNTILDDNLLLDAKGSSNKGIKIGNDIFVGRNSILSCKNGDIILEDNCNIGFNCEIFSSSRVYLNKHVLVAAYTYIIGGGHEDKDLQKPFSEQEDISFGIEVGANVWLGAGVKVLDGAFIGADSMIGAGAVVAKDIPEKSVAVGIPAKVIRTRE